MIALQNGSGYTFDQTRSLATGTIEKDDFLNTPIAVGDSFELLEGTAFSIDTTDLLANDTDPDEGPQALDVARGAGGGPAIGNSPQHGFLTWLADQQRLIYTPYPGFVGQDTFTYRVTDGRDKSSPATVTLNVHENLTAVSVAIASDEEDQFSIDESNLIEKTSDFHAVYAVDVPFEVTASLASDASSSATVRVYDSATGAPVGSFGIAPGQVESRKFVVPITQSAGLAGSLGLIAVVSDSATGQPIATEEEEEEVRQFDLSPLGEATVFSKEAAAVYTELALASVTSNFISSVITQADRDAAVTQIRALPGNENMTQGQAETLLGQNIDGLAEGIKNAAAGTLTGGIDRVLSAVAPTPRVLVGGRSPLAPVFDFLGGLLPEAKRSGIEDFLADPAAEDPLNPIFTVDLIDPEALFGDVGNEALMAALTGNKAAFIDGLRDKPIIKSLKAHIPFSLNQGPTGSLNFELTNLSIEGLRDSRLNFGFLLDSPVAFPALGLTITEFGFVGSENPADFSANFGFAARK